MEFENEVEPIGCGRYEGKYPNKFSPLRNEQKQEEEEEKEEENMRRSGEEEATEEDKNTSGERGKKR